MKNILTLLAFAFLICSCNTKQKTNKEEKQTEPMETKTELSNKDKAVAVLASLETGDQTAITYINPNKYIQHNLAVADGLAGFGEVMKHAPEGGFKAKVVRSFQDGDYTFSHTIYDFFGPKVGFDIFRFEDGKIVEHWDNLAELTPANPSGHTQTDGTTEIKDLDKTEANKAIVDEFLNTVLVNGEFDKMANYFDGDNYIQHNSMIGDGLSGLGKALEDMAKNGVTMVYDKVHKVLGEGNFVLAVSEGKFAGAHTSFYDLFRIENGKIAEHWDIIETILPEADRKNTNGKFNF
jgi:predicted SnoaL-like aldol condensation-catalyzing enzyme